MTHIRVMYIFGVFFERRGLLGTVYAINHIHCTHRKLNMHDGLLIDIIQAGSWTLWGVRPYRNRQGRVYYNRYREYTSYEDEIKSNVELNESSSSHKDFKPDINCSAKFVSTGTDRKSRLPVWQLSVYFTGSALVKASKLQWSWTKPKIFHCFLQEVCSCFTIRDIIRNTQHVLWTVQLIINMVSM